MSEPIIMPQVGQDIEKAVILEWRVCENDHVSKGDILFVVESDKAIFEIEAETSGVILKILFEEGEEAKVFEPVAYIGEPGESIEKMEASGDSSKTEQSIVHRQTVTTDLPLELSKTHASPSARRIAREYDVDLSGISGTGPNGRICKRDVLNMIDHRDIPSPSELQNTSAMKTHSVPVTIKEISKDIEIQFSKMRKATAERLTLSKQTIPHFYHAIDVDMTATLDHRKEYNKSANSRISVNDILVMAVATTLNRFPLLNAHVFDNKISIKKAVNIGIAVSNDEGLLVPVIPDVAALGIREISLLSHEIIQNARQGILKTKSPASFTISNMSMYQINYFIPIINPPECAILGVGGLQKRVIPIGKTQTAVRDIITLTLACDHRAVDGDYAARFLKSLKRNIEHFALK
ncbi:MAG: 2-oxo acid dehydrogenase subunit E2 [Candidatus Latescibacteria bacterium]|nr:2-oxo acid dehydrogenase subunit E2 [Candidatus Latescibacterota bacterium]